METRGLAANSNSQDKMIGANFETEQVKHQGSITALPDLKSNSGEGSPLKIQQSSLATWQLRDFEGEVNALHGTIDGVNTGKFNSSTRLSPHIPDAITLALTSDQQSPLKDLNTDVRTQSYLQNYYTNISAQNIYPFADHANFLQNQTQNVI